jgi:hypothetical protein
MWSTDLVRMGTSDLFFYKNKNYISKFKNLKKNICMLPTICPINVPKILFKYFVFWLHKNNKHLDLSMYISNL